MLGNIINGITIISGSLVGATFKKSLNTACNDILMQAMGLSACVLGISSAINCIPKSKYPILFILSLSIGGLIGQKLDLEDRLNRLAAKFSNNELIEGLSTAVLLFCVGTLSILGSIESALKGDNTLLFTKSILDGITSLVLASTYGISIIFSSIIVFGWQGLIYLSANSVSRYATNDLLNEMSIVGGLLVLGLGLGILNIKKIKVLNMFPALFIPIVFFIIKGFIKL